MAKELKDIKSVNTGLKQSIHTFEGRFSQVQTVINFVFKGSHLDFAN